MNKVKCQFCGKEIDKDPHFSYKRYYSIKFCSVLCRATSRKGNKGKKHNEETKAKISKNHHDVSGSNNPMHGKFHSDETKRKMREGHWDNSGENNFFYGKTHSQETKRKIRLQRLERLEETFGVGFVPNWNKKACKYFEKFDKENNTEGQYATNGGEYKIEELGYWVDYINHDLKIIIEWDEYRHYFKGKLKEKDVLRQKEIMGLYPEYEFIRIDERKME